jgi:hypothetical protein
VVLWMVNGNQNIARVYGRFVRVVARSWFVLGGAVRHFAVFICCF